ncbi:MAG: hypothetical protein JNL10_05020 [Verrucomicrobiales bacterium]|nr:hypothetical protein [Verrucomicrobiales bacterium]
MALFAHALGVFLPVLASESTLHPLPDAIEPGEIHVTLRGAAIAGEDYAVILEYRPWRERDVRKTRHLRLFGGWMGGASGKWIRTQREEFHLRRQRITAADTQMDFVVPLRDPDPGYASYQLSDIAVVGSVTGTLRFGRWFAGVPALESGFGISGRGEVLCGIVRPSGLGAFPLRGWLPLWPALRRVDLEVHPVAVPTVCVFEASQKHHWDGWRQGTPDFWPGGQTVALRHIAGSTFWREHTYPMVAPASEAPSTRPGSPAGVLSGVQLEIFWPEGGILDFPETRLDGEVEMVSAPVSSLPPRAAASLAESVRLRPGQEPGSLASGEWEALVDSLPDIERPLGFERVQVRGGEPQLRISRKTGFNEPWICILGSAYDDNQRYRVISLVVSPERWRGPVPE